MLLLKGKKQKIYFYFIIFLLFTTIFNTNLSNFFSKKFKVEYIEKFDDNLNIKEINDLEEKNIFNINKKTLRSSLNKNPLVKYFEIKKIFPNTLKVNLVKSIPIAKIIENENYLYIGDNGKVFKSKKIYTSIPEVLGEKNLKNINYILQTLNNSSFAMNDIKIIKIFPSKRFDIIFSNGRKIKFPLKIEDKFMKYAFEIFNNGDMQRIIDLRLNKKIISSK